MDKQYRFVKIIAGLAILFNAIVAGYLQYTTGEVGSIYLFMSFLAAMLWMIYKNKYTIENKKVIVSG